MDVRISLSPTGDLRLHLESGRFLDISSDHALKYVKKILKDAESLKHQPLGYCRNFPTQHVVDAWLKQDTEAKREAAREKREMERLEFERLHGLKIADLDISL